MRREIPLHHTSLSQSTATEKTRLLLQHYGMDVVAAKKLTEKSMKIASVSALGDSGECGHRRPVEDDDDSIIVQECQQEF